MWRRFFLILSPLFAVALLACGDEDDSKVDHETATGGTGGADLAFSTTAFADGEEIPAQYTCDGADISPPLAWSDLPEGTASLAVMVIDPDANDCAHWAVFDLPATLTGLDEAVSPGGALPAGAVELANFRGAVGYAGPCPPARHHYSFTLYALDVSSLGVASSASFSDLDAAIQPHLLASAAFGGEYGS